MTELVLSLVRQVWAEWMIWRAAMFGGPAPPAQRRAPNPDLELVWHFRATILDRLDEYFGCIRRLQRYDPHSYALFSRIGFAVPADKFANPDSPMLESLTAGLPRVAFGGILCGGFRSDEQPNQCAPSFLYFSKIRRPSRVQRVEGDIYRVTALYDDRKRSSQWRARNVGVLVCHVCVQAGGAVTLLKEAIDTPAQIVSRRGRAGRREVFRLSSTQWAYPWWLTQLASEHAMTAERLARWLFLTAMVTYGASIKRIVIRAKQGGSVAAFGIDLPRAKYFFADRNLAELAADGRRKRIFHSVVQHDRTLASGRQTQVKHHYRGLRDFSWNGYQIHIVLPQNTNMLEFAAPGSYLDDLSKADRSRYLTEAETGAKFAEVLNT